MDSVSVRKAAVLALRHAAAALLSTPVQLLPPLLCWTRSTTRN
jgi:hypothetical protein